MQKKDGEIMIRFGTGGWRAVTGEEFLCANIRMVAAAVSR